MSYVPAPHLSTASDTVIWPGSYLSCGIALLNLNLTSFASAAWPTANKAIYVPFVLYRDVTVYQVGWVNGSGAQSGTREVGVYKLDGTKVVSGSATASGVTASQRVNVTDTAVAAGAYYLAMSDSGTATLFSMAPVAPYCATFGILSQTSASPLPATATYAVDQTLAYVPLAFLQLRSTL